MNRLVSFFVLVVVLILTGCSSSNDSFSTHSIQKRKYRKGFHFPNRSKHLTASEFSIREPDTSKREVDQSETRPILEPKVFALDKANLNDSTRRTKNFTRVKNVIANRKLDDTSDKVISFPKQKIRSLSSGMDEGDDQFALISLIMMGVSILLIGLFPPLVLVSAGLGIFFALKSRRNVGVSDASTIGLIGNIVLLILGLLFLLFLIAYVLFIIGFIFI